ncbi:MAG: zinc ribbon domain-containing protein [Bacilli bacterium]|nr:zinc ribbon domain-containing protein [Bacilli bacterium]
MECPKCGNILDENETSCKNCGEKVKENTLNQVSKGGGKTQTPTEQEKAAAQRAAQEHAQAQAMAAQTQQQQIQNNINQQEYMMLRQQMLSAKKNSNLTLALVVILIAVVATFGGILLMKKLHPSETKSIKESAAKQDSTVKAEDPGSSPGTSTEPGTAPKEEVQTSTDIEIGSYIFTFPSNYETNFQDGMGISIDYTNKVQFVYTIMNSVSYESAKASMDDFKEYLNGVGFAVQSYQEQTIGNRKWIIFNGILNNMDAMYAITRLNSSATFQVTIFNLGYKTNSDVIAELGSVIDNARVKGTSSGSQSSGSSSQGGSTQKPSGGSSQGGSSQGSSSKPSSGAVEA